MGILGVFLLVVFVIACILLVFMVIIQDSDSDSLGGVFAGGSGSAFGSRSTNVVIRFTYVLGALFFMGPESTQDFALTLIVGIIAGTYSSIALATPLLVAVAKWQGKA